MSEQTAPIYRDRLAKALEVVGPVDVEDSEAGWLAYAEDIADAYECEICGDVMAAERSKLLGALPEALIASGFIRRYMDYANSLPTMSRDETPESLARQWAEAITAEIGKP